MAGGNRIDLLDVLRKCGQEGDVDFLQDAVRMMAQALIELEASMVIGAEPYERSEGRKTHRNGYRERAWDTRVGTLPLRVPKPRQGTFFPSLLEPRRRASHFTLADRARCSPRGGRRTEVPGVCGAVRSPLRTP